MQSATSVSADFLYIDRALKNVWEDYKTLRDEVTDFVPRTLEEMRAGRDAEFARVKALNPTQSDEQIAGLVDFQFNSNAQPGVQFQLRFGDKIMSTYVTVLFLAHALSEALINATLAEGLAGNGAPDLLPVLHRAEFREKWCIGPLAFSPQYNFDKGTALYETLNRLCKQRNGFIHYKVSLSVGEQPIFQGTKFQGGSLAEHLDWMQRYFSLPYDLADHLRTKLPDCVIPFLFHRDSISNAPAHHA